MARRLPDLIGRLTALNSRERVLVLVLVALATAHGVGRLLDAAYLTPAREVRAAVAAAEAQLQHQQQLLAREDQIQARYAALTSAALATLDTLTTEADVLRKLSELAGPGLHVKSVVPRLGTHDGEPVMFVAVDVEGPFDGVVTYLQQVLGALPSRVSSLSLSTGAEAGVGVVCRLSLRVGGLGHEAG